MEFDLKLQTKNMVKGGAVATLILVFMPNVYVQVQKIFGRA